MPETLIVAAFVLSLIAYWCALDFVAGRRMRRRNQFIHESEPWLVRKGFEFEDRRMRRLP